MYGLNVSEGGVRYIGVTSKQLDVRLSGHFAESLTRSGTHKRHWLRSALDADQAVEIELLDTAPTSADALWLERLWIAVYRACGAPLVNAIDGGGGALNPTAATRQKLRDSHLGKTLSEDTKQRMRKPKHYPKSRASRVVTELFRQRMREVALARPQPSDSEQQRLRTLRVGVKHPAEWRQTRAREARAFHAAMREGRDAIAFAALTKE